MDGGNLQAQYAATIEILQNLIKNANFAKQRKPLEEVQRTICRAMENDKKMGSQCQKLKSEIALNSSKIKAAVQLAEEDKTTIDMLKGELDKAWLIIKEKKLDNRKASQVNSESLLMLNQSITQNDVEKMKKERKIMLGEVHKLKISLENEMQNVILLQEEKTTLLQKIESMKNLQNERARMKLRLESNEKQMQAIKLDLSALKSENESLLQENEKFKLQVFELEEKLVMKEKLWNEHSSASKAESDDNELFDCNAEKSSDIQIKLEKKLTATKGKKKLKKLQIRFEKINRLYKIGKVDLMQTKINFHERTCVLNATKTENIQLRRESSEKTREIEALRGQNDELLSEINKMSLSMNLLEELRDNYVSNMGKLEDEVHILREKLSKIECCKYLDTIETLQTELASMEADLQSERISVTELKTELAKTKKELHELNDIVKENEEVIAKILYEINKEYSQIVKDDTSCEDSDMHLDRLSFYCSIRKLENRIFTIIEYLKKLIKINNELNDEINVVKKEEFTNFRNNKHRLDELFPNVKDLKSNASLGCENKEASNVTECLKTEKIDASISSEVPKTELSVYVLNMERFLAEKELNDCFGRDDGTTVFTEEKFTDNFESSDFEFSSQTSKDDFSSKNYSSVMASDSEFDKDSQCSQSCELAESEDDNFSENQSICEERDFGKHFLNSDSLRKLKDIRIMREIKSKTLPKPKNSQIVREVGSKKQVDSSSSDSLRKSKDLKNIKLSSKKQEETVSIKDKMDHSRLKMFRKVYENGTHKKKLNKLLLEGKKV